MIDDKNKIVIVSIVILVLIIFGLGGFIVYDKFFSKNNNISDRANISDAFKGKSENIESLEISDPLVVGLLEKVTGGMNCKDYSELYLKDKKFSSGDFTNEEIYNLALNNLYNKIVNLNTNPAIYNPFTVDELNDEIERIVGKNYKFKHKTYETCPIWNYNAVDKNYIVSSNPACGCTTGPYHNIVKTVKVERDSNSIVVYQRVIFVDSATGKGYSDYKKNNEITDLVMSYTDLGGNLITTIDENNLSNFSKGALYRIVFEDQNNSYIFSFAEPIQ